MRRKKDKDESTSRKKQKKHKKHKKKRDREDADVDVVTNEGPTLKLKIRFGSETLSTSKIVGEVKEEPVEELPQDDEDVEGSDTAETEPCDESYTEEDRWLDAMEKGNLDDYGEIKKQKDSPATMTARQRALKGESVIGETELLQLPMYPEKSVIETEEYERKKKVRAKKRKQEAVKKIEETKTQTIEKLLTKGQKSRKECFKTAKELGSHIRYVANADGFSMSFSDNLDLPWKPTCRAQRPAPQFCKATGCMNLKKYACAKTLIPVCSLQCYRTVNKAFD